MFLWAFEMSFRTSLMSLRASLVFFRTTLLSLRFTALITLQGTFISLRITHWYLFKFHWCLFVIILYRFKDLPYFVPLISDSNSILIPPYFRVYLLEFLQLPFCYPDYFENLSCIWPLSDFQASSKPLHVFLIHFLLEISRYVDIIWSLK